MLTKTQQRLFVCLLRIALCAAFINALAPSISYLFAVSAGKQVIEICTSFGPKRVLMDFGTPASGSSSPNHHEARCKFCLASLDAAAFVLPQPLHLLAVTWIEAKSLVLHVVPSAGKGWPEGLPRAPPARPAQHFQS